MKTLHSLALGVILAPALTLAAGSAIAQEARTDTEREQAQRQNPDDSFSRDEGRDAMQRKTQPGIQPGTQTNTQSDRMSGDLTQSPAATGQRMGQQGTFLPAKPARGFHADKLIGSDVKAQGDDEVGTISDLIIDENGQVVAVIVGVGGFLGMGEKDVAIGWDALQRTAKGNDEYEYRVNATRESLTTAPAYKKK